MISYIWDQRRLSDVAQSLSATQDSEFRLSLIVALLYQFFLSLGYIG